MHYWQVKNYEQEKKIQAQFNAVARGDRTPVDNQQQQPQQQHQQQQDEHEHRQQVTGTKRNKFEKLANLILSPFSSPRKNRGGWHRASSSSSGSRQQPGKDALVNGQGQGLSQSVWVERGTSDDPWTTGEQRLRSQSYSPPPHSVRTVAGLHHCSQHSSRPKPPPAAGANTSVRGSQAKEPVMPERQLDDIGQLAVRGDGVKSSQLQQQHVQDLYWSPSALDTSLSSSITSAECSTPSHHEEKCHRQQMKRCQESASTFSTLTPVQRAIAALSLSPGQGSAMSCFTLPTVQGVPFTLSLPPGQGQGDDSPRSGGSSGSRCNSVSTMSVGSEASPVAEKRAPWQCHNVTSRHVRLCNSTATQCYI